MFAYPKQAEFNRVLPKNKIYGYAKPSRKVQTLFVEEVEQIVWRFKLAPETINVPARGHVRELQVFDLVLKYGDFSEDVLRTIDKTIIHPIFYQVHHGKRVRFATAYKRPSEADAEKWVVSDYFITDWQPASTTFPSLPVALEGQDEVGRLGAILRMLRKAIRKQVNKGPRGVGRVTLWMATYSAGRNRNMPRLP